MLLTTDKVWAETTTLERLPTILEEIQPPNIIYWVLQWIDLSSTYLLHFSSVSEIEVASQTHRGIIIDNEEFIKFVSGIMDISQGTFIALTDKESIHPKFILENFDSCEWVIETKDQEIINRLVSFGWKKSEHQPQRTYYNTVSE
jgi:hypothetical protein